MFEIEGETREAVSMNSFLFAAVLVFGLMLGCVGTQAEESTPTLRTLAAGNFSAFQEPVEKVFKSSAEWEEAWKKISPRATQAAKLPEVDFDKEMVVLVSLGKKRTGGYAIRVIKVEEAGGKLKIFVRRKEPARGGFAIQAITAPFHAVAVPRSDLEPEFVESPEK